MKLVLISDTHCQHKALKLPQGDVLIHAGDWTHRGEKNLTIEFLQWFDKQNYKYKVFVAGNHDFLCEKDPVLFEQLVVEHGPSCTYLWDSSVEIEGYVFHGSPVSPWFCDWAFNRSRGPEIQKHWDLIPSNVEVLITHSPIYGYGDKLSAYGSEPGELVGCMNLRDTIDIRLKDLKLHVGGHIHEGSGIYSHGNIIVVNAAVLDERYRLKNPPRVVELPDKPTNPDPK